MLDFLGHKSSPPKQTVFVRETWFVNSQNAIPLTPQSFEILTILQTESTHLLFLEIYVLLIPQMSQKGSIARFDFIAASLNGGLKGLLILMQSDEILFWKPLISLILWQESSILEPVVSQDLDHDI
jgi:hypothetical protein